MEILKSTFILVNIKKLAIYLNIINIFNNFILIIINKFKSFLFNDFLFLIYLSNNFFLNIFAVNILIF